MKRFVGLSTGILFVVACGSSGGMSPMTATPTLKAAAATSVTAASGLAKIKTTPNDAGAMNGFGSIYTSGNQLTSAAMSPSTAGAVTGALTAVTGALDSTGCGTTSGGTTTYNNCTYGSSTVNGTITVAGDTITVDLTTNYGGGTGTVTGLDMKWTGSVTVTATQINGSLRFDTTASTTQYGAISGYTTMTFNGINLDTAGCATGGTMEAYTESGMQGYTYHGTVDVTFGPACGDAAMEGSTDVPTA